MNWTEAISPVEELDQLFGYGQPLTSEHAAHLLAEVAGKIRRTTLPFFALHVFPLPLIPLHHLVDVPDEKGLHYVVGAVDGLAPPDTAVGAHALCPVRLP